MTEQAEILDCSYFLCWFNIFSRSSVAQWVLINCAFCEATVRLLFENIRGPIALPVQGTKHSVTLANWSLPGMHWGYSFDPLVW